MLHFGRNAKVTLLDCLRIILTSSIQFLDSRLCTNFYTRYLYNSREITKHILRRQNSVQRLVFLYASIAIEMTWSAHNGKQNLHAK